MKFEGAAEALYAERAPQAANPDLRSDMERAATQSAYHRRKLEEKR